MKVCCISSMKNSLQVILKSSFSMAAFLPIRKFSNQLKSDIETSSQMLDENKKKKSSGYFNISL